MVYTVLAVVTKGSSDLGNDTYPLERVADAVSELSDAHAGELPAAACRALGCVLGLDEVRFVTTAGELGSWACDTDHRRSIRRHSVQTAVSGATERPLQWLDGEQTLLAVPVRRGGRRLAVLVGSVWGDRDFADEDLAACGLVAAAAAAGDVEVIEHQPSPGTRTLESALSDLDVGWAIVDALKTLLQFDACRVYLPSPGDNRVVPSVQCGLGQWPCPDAAAREACAPGVGAAGKAMLDRASRVVRSARSDQHAAKIIAEVAGDESLLVVPVVADGVTCAVIVVSRIGADRFGLADLRLVERIAARAALACRAVGLSRTASDQARVAQGLLDLSAALAAQTSVEGVASMLVATVDRLVECAAVSVWFRTGDEMRPAAVRGYTPEESARLSACSVPVTDPLFAGALDRRDVVARRVDQAGVIVTHLDSTPSGSTFAVVAVGERSANRAALVIRRGPRRGALSAVDRQMLLGIADQSLIAFTNRMLYAELDESFMATVTALATALETKDEYTGDHASELESLSTTLAERLGLSGTELRDVTLGAALHDIGKIGIPSPILLKPGPLTDAEWEVMRRHPELGARIIEPVAALDGARELVIACHEHWDGSGYPHGLAGEQIPLGARIILACDAFHAMISDRVYRKGMPVSEAVIELECHAGAMFDPAVADALVSMVGDG